MDVRAARGMGGDVGVTWTAAEVLGILQGGGAFEVGKASDGGVAQPLVI
jgi:hypothetical protein